MTVREEEGNTSVCTLSVAALDQWQVFFIYNSDGKHFLFLESVFTCPIAKKNVCTPVEKMNHQYFLSIFQGEKDYLMQIPAKCLLCQLEMSKVAVIFFINLK